jgi:acyl-CoA synthetase (AMP-forming)/AMP-acid ligase II
VPANEPHACGTLRTKLPHLTVFRDGTAIDPAVIANELRRLAHDLAAFEGRRVALLASRAEQLLVVLAAAEAAGCELLVSRLPTLSPALIKSWKVAAVIGQELQVQGTALVLPKEFAFHVLISTSGTTGEPKLARHTIQGLFGRIRQPDSGRDRPRWLLTYDPATFGGMQVLLTALVSSAELVTVTHPVVTELAKQALLFKPTHISGTPTFWRSFLLVLGERARTLSLRQITLGGEIADQTILDRLRENFPAAALIHIYASTEAGALFAVRDGRAGFPAKWLETGVDGVELRIQDGMLRVRSPRTMLGYVNLDSFGVLGGDGWLATGDLVEHLGDRVVFGGREDLLLNVGGAKVRPEEVEAALLALPEVADARVYGVPNPVTGMIVAAEIVPAGEGGEDFLRRSILAQMRARLDTHKVPRVLRFVESITVSTAGKKGRSQS